MLNKSGELIAKSGEFLVMKIIILEPEFDRVLQQFVLTPADYERMSVEELVGMEK